MVIEEAPVLVEEAAEVVDEVEEDIKQQELQPYQLTHFYQNELGCFDKAYTRPVNERYEGLRLLFEQQQERLYKAAVVLGVQVGGQQG
jgi:hypothetical protein